MGSVSKTGDKRTKDRDTQSLLFSQCLLLCVSVCLCLSVVPYGLVCIYLLFSLLSDRDTWDGRTDEPGV